MPVSRVVTTPVTILLRTMDDCYGNAWWPDNVYNTGAVEVGYSNAASGRARGLIKPTVGDLPSTLWIESVTYKPTIYEDQSSNARTMRGYRLLRDWVETEVTWNEYRTGNSWQTAGAAGALDREAVECGSVALSDTEPVGSQITIPLEASVSKTAADIANGWLLQMDTEVDDAYLFYSTDIDTSGNPVDLPQLIVVGEMPAMQTGPLLYVTFAGTWPYPPRNPMRLLTSADGETWMELTEMIYKPGLEVQNPSIVKIGETIWLTHQHLSPTHSTVARSDDGGRVFNWVAEIDWSGIGGVTHTWAPELFVDDDDSVHILASVSTDGAVNFANYEVHPTNAEFTTWSAPVHIAGLTDNSTDCIDPNVVRLGATYYMFTKGIRLWSSNALLAGWGLVAVDIAGESGEGPCVIPLPGGGWRMYFDDRIGLGYGLWYCDSADDDFTTWGAVQAADTPFIARHGTIIRL